MLKDVINALAFQTPFSAFFGPACRRELFDHYRYLFSLPESPLLPVLACFSAAKSSSDLDSLRKKCSITTAPQRLLGKPSIFNHFYPQKAILAPSSPARILQAKQAAPISPLTHYFSTGPSGAMIYLSFPHAPHSFFFVTINTWLLTNFHSNLHQA